jgi:hypothetical protein
MYGCITISNNELSYDPVTLLLVISTKELKAGT